MSSKKIILFVLILACAGILYVKFAASNKNEIQGLLEEPITVETNAMNLSVSIIAETDNDIIVKACDTPKTVFSDCTTNKLSKVSEHNGIKVYRRGTHDVAFVKDNGKWKTFGNVFLLSVMEKIEKQPKAIFARGCGDWKIAVIEETEKDIKVEDCAWGMGWSCSTYKIPKISDQDGVKIYKEDEVIFTNNNGKWGLTGHMCADRKIERKTGPIFQANCMDFEMLITAETDNEITVKRDFRTIYNIPKVAEQDGVKVYSDGKLLYHKDREAFINNNGEWVLLGHLCSKVNSTEVLTYKCPKSDRIIKVNSYTNNGLIVADIIECHNSDISKCEPQNNALFMLKDMTISDKDVFVNGDLRIEHAQNDWFVDDKLCE
ncbi:MAG: hypothetical protein IKO56_05170 [Alphaproteobacteria bacterium]|nr:hypothetical protein [Alphaproteobacteria bacterium]